MNSTEKDKWWRGGVFYQIYPRSYLDTNGDGIGDLPGITAKLDYIASLGVDGIWISPFFKSPMKDFGYDVSDYRDVDPMFGTLADFKNLLDQAHNLGLKIIVDMVLSHTSNEHEWFKESRISRENPKADWYVWADPKDDGTPPNNWLSVFGGAAWQYDTRRGQYYLHNFLTEQPDLNLHNPQVREALLGECKFWLDMGVDGFRLDAINFCVHDKQLRDNPAKQNINTFATQLDFVEPYARQVHMYDRNQPENLGFLKSLRELTNQYPGTFLLGEVGDDNAAKIAAEYSAGEDYLHTTYSFALLSGLSKKLTPAYIRGCVEEALSQPHIHWPSWAFSNHDVVRAVSRFSADKTGTPELAKLLIALLLCLRGSAFIYEGEELGLPEAVIPFEKIQDPWGKYLWPAWQGRDGARTPMPWEENKPNAGFSTAEPWLPVPENHHPRAADRQEKDPASVLNFTRAFIKWYKTRPELVSGDIAFHDEGEAILSFTRDDGKNRTRCLFNLTDEETAIGWTADKKAALYDTGAQTAHIADGRIVFPAYGIMLIAE